MMELHDVKFIKETKIPLAGFISEFLMMADVTDSKKVDVSTLSEITAA